MNQQCPGIAVAFAVLALAGCATATPYQPAQGTGMGYQEQKLETNRYAVSFSGNPKTSPQTVENYLLYRAAEITLDNGSDYFIVVDRSRSGADDAATPARSSSSPRFSFGIGSFGGFGGSSIGIGASTGAGSTTTADDETVQARADILIFKGEKPDTEQNAFDARQVKANLEPVVQRAKG